MNDRNLEELLQRYAPVGPPDDLRARAVRGAVDTRRAWPWMVAASLLLALTIGAQIASSRVREDLAQIVTPEPADHELTMLEEALGGGPEARRAAELMLFERSLERARQDAERAVGTAGTIHE